MRSLVRGSTSPGGSSGGSGAPTDATYIVQTGHGDLSAEQALSSLASGVLKNTNGTGVLSVATVDTAEITDDAVTYAKIQNVSATSRILGRKTAGAGNTEELTISEALDFVGSAANGDILIRSAGSWTRLAKGTASQFLRMNSGATLPEWTTGSMLIYAGAGDTGGYAPAAGSNFYFGIQFGLDPNTTDGGPSFTVPVSGTINFCTVKQSTLGTNGINGENIVYRLRKNATTDSNIVATLDTDVVNVEGTNSALNFSVTAGDSVAVKGTPPGAWTTSPTVMFWSVVMRLDVP